MAWNSHLITNIQSCCRTCLCDMAEKTSYDIFSETEESQCLRHILSYITTIELISSKTLPNMLCESCHTEIMNFNTFKTNVEKVEDLLKKHVQGCEIVAVTKEELKDEKYEPESLLYYNQSDIKADGDDTVFNDNEDISDDMLEVTTNLYTDDEKVEDIKPKIAHSKTKKEPQKHICDVCGQEFKYRNKLIKHMLTHNQFPNEATKDTKLKFQCDECDKNFKSVNSLCAHKRTHSKKDRILMCSVCSKVFKKVSHLKRHELSHREKIYRCMYCARSFADENRFNEHIKLHKEAKKHVCLLCNKSFINIMSLQNHLKTHVKDNAFLCYYCGKKFGSIGNLNQHINRHTKKTLFPCDKCSKKFVSKGGLKSHLVRHSTEKLYKCELCDAKFGHRYSLERHKFRHLGVKPYSCSSCMKGFSSKYHLSRHFRIHSGEKPYQCDMCERSFAQKGDLNRHRRLHTGDKYHKCTQCSQTFRLKSDLLQHMTDHYNASQTPDKTIENEPNTKVSLEKPDKSYIIVEVPHVYE